MFPTNGLSHRFALHAAAVPDLLQGSAVRAEPPGAGHSRPPHRHRHVGFQILIYHDTSISLDARAFQKVDIRMHPDGDADELTSNLFFLFR